jgi:predicted signal transduction protein with EAL and GGDEF domain
MTTYEDRYEKWMADLMREAEEAIEFPESRERLEKGFINLDEFLIQHLRSGCEGKDMIVDETSRRMFAVLNVIAEKINKIKGDSFAE